MKVINTYVVWCNRLGTLPATLQETECGSWFWTHFDCGHLHHERLSAQRAAQLIESTKMIEADSPINRNDNGPKQGK